MSDNANFEAFLKILKAKQSKSRVMMLNPKRVEEMQSAYKFLSKIVLDVSPDAIIKCEMNEINDGSASISIKTDEIIAYEVIDFIKGIESADNFEIFPLTNGNIQMNVMFDGVLKQI